MCPTMCAEMCTLNPWMCSKAKPGLNAAYTAPGTGEEMMCMVKGYAFFRSARLVCGRSIYGSQGLGKIEGLKGVL
jgi:hypothetical protein